MTIVFTVGRMNPPTSGHLSLIENMMRRAVTLGESKVYVLLSHSQDKKKNPLQCDRKRDLLREYGMIESIINKYPKLNKIKVHIRCGKDNIKDCGDNFIIKHICDISKIEKSTQFEMFVGEDRGSSYDFLDKYLSKRNPPIKIEYSKPLVRGDMSATYIRGLITSNKKDIFLNEYVTNVGLSEETAEILYDELHSILSKKASTKKASTKKASSSAASSVASSAAAAASTPKTKTKKTKKSARQLKYNSNSNSN